MIRMQRTVKFKVPAYVDPTQPEVKVRLQIENQERFTFEIEGWTWDPVFTLEARVLFYARQMPSGVEFWLIEWAVHPDGKKTIEDVSQFVAPILLPPPKKKES